MAYFQKFPTVNYKFGDEVTFNAFQDISAYVDMIDRIKDDTTFYQYYTILPKERPDWLSFKLYEDNRFYWTFFLLNDSLRRQGWPLEYDQIVAKAKADYPHTTIVTRNLFATTHTVGSIVEGQSSGATGKVIRRNLDLGQLVIESTNTKTFTVGELLNDADDEQITITSVADEHLSAHHYENAAKETVDFDPTVGPGALLTEITYLDRMVSANDELKEIKVIRPNAIEEISTAFQRAIAG